MTMFYILIECFILCTPSCNIVDTLQFVHMIPTRIGTWHKFFSPFPWFVDSNLPDFLPSLIFISISRLHSLTHATPTFSFILLQNKLTAVRGLRTAEGCGGFNDFNWTEHARTIREVQKHIFHFCLFSRARAQSAAK